MRGLWAAVYVALAGGILAVVWKAPQWRWEGRYKIEGLHTLPASALEKALPHPIGEPLFLIDPRRVRDAALAYDPVLEDVRVRRWLFPARINVHVTERHPEAIVDPSVLTKAVMAASGSVASRPGARPVVTSSSRPGLATCLDAEGEDFACKEAALPLRVRVAALPLSQDSRKAFEQLVAAWPAGLVGTVDMRVPASWSANVTVPARMGISSGLDPRSAQSVNVLLGDDQDLALKFRTFLQVLSLTNLASSELEYVDVRFPDAPAFKEAGNPLKRFTSPSSAVSTQDGHHGQGLAIPRHRHRADGGHPARHSDQKPG